MRSHSFSARRVENALLYAHTAEAPTDEEWATVLRLYDELDSSEVPRVLVYTDGGAPHAAQRALLNAKLGARPVRIAVLTPSALARAAGVAVGWFRPHIRVFGPLEVAPALEFLGVSERVGSSLLAALAELKLELGIKR